MTESNLHKLINGKDDHSELASRDIEKKVVYGSVVVKKLPEDSVIIIDGNNIEIVKKDKIIAIDGDLNVKVDGEIQIKTTTNSAPFLSSGNISEEGLLSYSKLKLALETGVDSYGAPIQYLINPLDEDLITFDKIKIEQS